MCNYRVYAYRCGCESAMQCVWECEDIAQLKLTQEEKLELRCRPPERDWPPPALEWIQRDWCCSEYCCRLAVMNQLKPTNPRLTYLQARHILDSVSTLFPKESPERKARYAHRICEDEQEGDPMHNAMRDSKADLDRDAFIEHFELLNADWSLSVASAGSSLDRISAHNDATNADAIPDLTTQGVALSGGTSRHAESTEIDSSAPPPRGD